MCQMDNDTYDYYITFNYLNKIETKERSESRTLCQYLTKLSCHMLFYTCNAKTIYLFLYRIDFVFMCDARKLGMLFFSSSFFIFYMMTNYRSCRRPSHTINKFCSFVRIMKVCAYACLYWKKKKELKH